MKLHELGGQIRKVRHQWHKDSWDSVEKLSKFYMMWRTQRKRRGWRSEQYCLPLQLHRDLKQALWEAAGSLQPVDSGHVFRCDLFIAGRCILTASTIKETLHQAWFPPAPEVTSPQFYTIHPSPRPDICFSHLPCLMCTWPRESIDASPIYPSPDAVLVASPWLSPPK